jgi:hypothetical protein
MFLRRVDRLSIHYTELFIIAAVRTSSPTQKIICSGVQCRNFLLTIRVCQTKMNLINAASNRRLCNRVPIKKTEILRAPEGILSRIFLISQSVATREAVRHTRSSDPLTHSSYVDPDIGLTSFSSPKGKRKNMTHRKYTRKWYMADWPGCRDLCKCRGFT